MSNRPYIVGNWKMNGTRAALSEARAIDRGAARHPGVEVGIAPPATLLSLMADAVETISLGGQDCHQASAGAFTGDISAAMFADVGAKFLIVGHSERRAGHKETDTSIRAKAEAVMASGLGVIVCVGETAAQRDGGNAEAVVTKQLSGSLPVESGTPGQITVAYEPVWAIGSGKVPSLDDVSTMHRTIRAKLEERYGAAHAGMRIIYGGSVNAGNAAELLHCDEVGGALVGGASLTADSFLAIVAAVAPELD